MPTIPSSEEERERTQEQCKTRKSWTKALLFWRKTEKKQSQKPTNPTQQINSVHPMQRRRAVSGPIYTCESDAFYTYKSSPSRSMQAIDHTSFPMTGFLTPTRKRERENRYYSLNQLNHSNVGSLSPIYLVT
ncbi:hypothetical protein AMTRI_Chr13g117420 [Amborella trichopoda]|uniref:Uncharacterized protein n=1 Tax=Amborella trichopoda TaxID=13333 RepID=W1NLB1_AMBTC|nr:hypothetical protein AMTR_s00129p00054300 [Amborella trichopoda]